MKRNKKHRFLSSFLALIVFVSAIVPNFNSFNTYSAGDYKVDNVEISAMKSDIVVTLSEEYEILLPDESELYVGNKIRLNYLSPNGSNLQVYWLESSDTDKASSKNGYDVFLHSEGEVTLTAHCSDNINIKTTFVIKENPNITTNTSLMLKLECHLSAHIQALTQYYDFSFKI